MSNTGSRRFPTSSSSEEEDAVGDEVLSPEMGDDVTPFIGDLTSAGDIVHEIGVVELRVGDAAPGTPKNI